ncbi:MAG: Ig-like domain-containing protein [Actinomycetota bacterium]
MRRPPLAALLVLAIGAFALAIPQAFGGTGTCKTSSPPSSSATVEVCIAQPSGLDPLADTVPVVVTVDVSNGRPVDSVNLLLDGTKTAQDDQSPYRFFIPTDLYVDGPHTIQVNASVQFAVPFTTPKTRLPVTFDNGNASPPPPRTGFVAPGVAGMQPAIVGATGDGADGGVRADAVIDEIVSWDPDLFLYLGDVYDNGTNEEMASWYGQPGQRWATMRDITAPTIGNHEYITASGRPYFDYWDGVPHFYAFNAGAWRVIVLDTMKAFNGYAVGSPQYEWLADELIDDEHECTLVSFHHPRFSVGKYEGSPWLQPLWALMADNGVDIAVTGHDHNYQRWKPLRASGNFDSKGTRQFVAGTGGHESYAIQRDDSRVVEAVGMVDGAIRFELEPGRAEFSFVTSNGQQLDSGQFSCSPTIDRQPPTAPAMLAATAVAPDRIDLEWDAASDDRGVTGYEVFRDGVLLDTTDGATTTYADTGVSADQTYHYRVRAFDEAGNRGERSPQAEATTPAGDVDPPSVPTGVTADAPTPFRVDLSWNASNDDVGVDAYDVYRNGTLVAGDLPPIPDPVWSDDDVTPGATYDYTVVARDQAGNASAPGGPATVTLSAGLFSDGFESGTLSAWTNSDHASVVDGIGLRGTHGVALVSTGTTRAYVYKTLPTPRKNTYTKVSFEVEEQGPHTIDLLAIRTAAGAGIVTAIARADGTLALLDERTSTVIGSARQVGTGVHDLQVRTSVAGSESKLVVWLDGQKVNALSQPRPLGTTFAGRVRLGDATIGRTLELVMDEVQVRTKQIP